MEKPTRIVKVPKPSSQSFNMHRPLAKNALLVNQVAHFKELEKELAPEHHTGIHVDDIKTEAQAAEYIRKMTVKLHRPAPRKKSKRHGTEIK